MEKELHISLAAEPLFHIGSFAVTNSLLVTWLVMVALIIFGVLVGRSPKVGAPKGWQNVIEYVFELLIGLMESVTQSREKAEKFFPFLTTFFLFIFVANMTDIIPGIGTIGIEHVTEHGSELVPFLRPPASDLNFTVALAIISVLTAQVFGVASLGFMQHAKKYFTIKGGPVYTFVGLLELISEIAKMVSFSFRLFGNIFAGEVLLTVIAVIVPFVVPLPFYFLEVFVAFVQALVFTMLSLVFFTVATTAHGEHAEKKAHSPSHANN